MKRDNAADLQVTQLLDPASVSTTQTTSSIDTAPLDRLSLIFNIGAVADLAASPLGNGSWAIKLQESADDSAFTDITDDAQILIDASKSPVTAPNSSTGVFLTLSAAAHQNNAYHVGVLPTKRYVRAVLTATLTPGASLIGVTAVGRVRLAPASN
jgi:hypothetical protein